MKISKIYLRICSLLFACFLVCGSILRPVVIYASPYDLMIGSSSNALMTLELDDTDYLMMSPRSSVATITNTINYNDSFFWIRERNVSTGVIITHNLRLDSIGESSYIVPSGCEVTAMGIHMRSGSLPSSGVYDMGVDLSSDFSLYYDYIRLLSKKGYTNASAGVSNMTFFPSDYVQSSGDCYFQTTVELASGLEYFEIEFYFDEPVSAGGGVSGRFKVNFTQSNSEPVYSSAGSGTSSSDIQSEMSDSLSDLSSSVDSMTEDLSSAAESLEYISTSQNLIIQGIDNVVMHISDQLFAFWNQLFNLIHVPTMAKMDDIIDAINNMDLEIEVNLDGLKTTINNMSTAVQNKLQSTTDQITGGYDNSGIVSDQTELDSALNEYQQAEDELFDDAKDHLTNFEFDTPLDQFIKPIQDISYFMTGIFNGLAGLNIPIQFSLTLTIALILIGYYRIKR